MKAGILAAGTGSRFVQAGWDEPKPLIRLQGKPIIRHVLENLFQAGATSVEVLLNGNSRFDPVERYLEGLLEAESGLRVWRQTTPSSFESFSRLMKRLAPPPFVISTVDSILDSTNLKHFLRTECYPPDCSLALAVTDYVSDEKPLWVSLDPSGKIDRIGEDVSDKHYVTAGIYLVLQDLEHVVPEEGFQARRFFLRHLIETGRTVWGRKFQLALDIDDPGDVRTGERILAGKTGVAGTEMPL